MSEMRWSKARGEGGLDSGSGVVLERLCSCRNIADTSLLDLQTLRAHDGSSLPM